VIFFFDRFVTLNSYPWFLGPIGLICNIWHWSILFTLGFSRLLGAYTMKLSKIKRYIFAIVLILITPLILQYLQSIRSSSILGNLYIGYYLMR
jgi:hypothetical protein